MVYLEPKKVKKVREFATEWYKVGKIERAKRKKFRKKYGGKYFELIETTPTCTIRHYIPVKFNRWEFGKLKKLIEHALRWEYKTQVRGYDLNFVSQKVGRFLERIYIGRIKCPKSIDQLNHEGIESIFEDGGLMDY